MSYILDALKKSDQLRQRGSTPTLLTAPTTPPVPKRPGYLLNSVLAAVLIAAGIAVGWWRPWQMKQPAPQAERIASMPVAPASPLAVPAPPSGLPEMTGGAQPELPTYPSTSAAPAEPVAAATAMKQETPAPANTEPPSSLPPPDPGVQNARGGPFQDRTPPAAAAVAEEKRVMALNDLPPSIRQEIPAIAIAFHAYSSSPEERRVMINGEMAEQGEPLAGGLSLEQITPDGVILGYKGFRFHHGVR